MTSRRQFLSKGSMLPGILLASQAPQILRAKPKPAEGSTLLGHGAHRYRLDTNWSQLDRARTPVLSCHEMVVDSKGRLIFVTDEVANNIIVMDRSGKYLDSWGTRWPGGHGLTLGAEGDNDALFIVDCGWFLDSRTGKWERQSGTVTKTDLSGRFIFNLGHPVTIGAYEPGMDYQPTEVAVAPNGDIYVADGYGSDYILHYDEHGNFIRKFGGHNNDNPAHNLDNAHGVAIDQRDPGRPVLVCTSRGENCFKEFTLDGDYLGTIRVPGAFVCRPVIHGKNLYSGVCWSREGGTGERTRNSGFVTILDGNNRVVSNPGGTRPAYKGGELQPLQQEHAVFKHCHDVCVDSDENLYVCQWNADQAHPYLLERVS